jgi:hypothetical protein
MRKLRYSGKQAGSASRREPSPVRKFRVRINLDAVRRSISKADRCALSVAEFEQLLHDSGFTQDGEHWIVAERDLGLLEPHEVLGCELIEPS